VHYWIGESTPSIANGLPGVLRNPAIYQGAWNSIHLSLWTAFFTAFLGIILGYAIAKGRGTRLSKLVEQIAFIPYVIPGIAFGAVYISMFAKPVGLFLPCMVPLHCWWLSRWQTHSYSARTGVSAMLQVGRELEEAGEVAGANAWERFRRIIFPLTSPGFVSGFLMTFITTMRELSLIILLVTPSTQVLASMTIDILRTMIRRWQTPSSSSWLPWSDRQLDHRPLQSRQFKGRTRNVTRYQVFW